MKARSARPQQVQSAVQVPAQESHGAHIESMPEPTPESMKQTMIRTAVAEALGTFILVLAITAAAVAATLARPLAGFPYGSLSVPIAGGLALAILVACLGSVSGAHVNPSVTLGLAVNRRFPWAYVAPYVIAQFVGAIAAAAVIWGLFGGPARSVAHLGATYPAAGVGVGRVFAAEAVVTFVLVLVIIAVTTDSRVPRGVAAVAIGAALATAILIAGPISGGGVNPARAIGPMIVAGRFTDWWAYLVAPIVGGVVAAAVYERVLRKGNAPKLWVEQRPRNPTLPVTSVRKRIITHGQYSSARCSAADLGAPGDGRQRQRWRAAPDRSAAHRLGRGRRQPGAGSDRPGDRICGAR